MARVAITGMGIVSPIGDNLEEVATSLKTTRSGLVHMEDFQELGFRSQVAGVPALDPASVLSRREMRFMGRGVAWGLVAMKEAIASAGLDESDVSCPDTGLVVGSGGPSTMSIIEAASITRASGPRRMGPTVVPKAMSSTASANLATQFQIKGVSYSITSACSTSSHCIGHAYQLIASGQQSVVFAGGCEDLEWSMANLFDAMGALSSAYNDTPATASRPYDANRDGFVIAGGGGIMVLEDLERAVARGATIYGEIVGYAANSDGFDMVAPSGEGAVRCMRLALAGVSAPVDYVNTHGTSTPAGDIREVDAMREVFGDNMPKFSSTKSLTGHSLGATGVHEAIYTLLMMRDGFISASAHIETVDPGVGDAPLVYEMQPDADINVALSSNFGFGGTNACLVFAKYRDGND